MSLFRNLFDKREKMNYNKGCNYIFNLALMQELQCIKNFSDISESDYRADIIGIVSAYLDTLPQEKCSGVRSTFGEDVLYYGTANGTMLVASHPIEANLKTVFLPQCQKKHGHYSQFLGTKMGNPVNTATICALAAEVLRVNGVASTNEKLSAVEEDIKSVIQWIDTILSKFRFI